MKRFLFLIYPILLFLSWNISIEVHAASFLEQLLSTPFSDQKNFLPELFNKMSPAVGAQVSKSRAPQAPSFNFHNPRILLAKDPAQGSLFLAINKESGEAEAMEWNPELMRYDFIVIKDIRARPPQIDKSPAIRESCLPCHQHGGPIFPSTPWVGVGPLRLPGDRNAKKNLGPLFSFGPVRQVSRSSSTQPGQPPTLAGGIFRFRDAVSEAADRLDGAQVCQLFWESPSIESAIKQKLVKFLIYKKYVNKRANAEIPAEKWTDFDPRSFSKAHNSRGVPDFLREATLTSLTSLNTQEEKKVLLEVNKILRDRKGLPAPFFVDQGIPVSTDFSQLKIGEEPTPLAITSKTVPLDTILSAGLDPLDPNDIQLSSDPKLLELGNPITRRPTRSRITSVNEMKKERRGGVHLDFELIIEKCLGPQFEDSETSQNQIKAISPSEFERFLNSKPFKDYLDKPYFPSLSVLSLWDTYASKGNHSPCNDNNNDNSTLVIQAEHLMDAVENKPSNYPDRETALKKLKSEGPSSKATNAGMGILQNRCNRCHERMKNSPALFNSKGHVIPEMLDQIKNVMRTGTMGKINIKPLDESEQNLVLQYLGK